MERVEGLMIGRQAAVCSLCAALVFATHRDAAALDLAHELYRSAMDSGAAWSVNAISDDVAAAFGYDYSADGIPEAPGSRPGDAPTRGVKLAANRAFPGTVEVVTLAPVGQHFTGDYQLRFDAWMNYDLAEARGAANGTTEFIGGGIGYDGVSADMPSGAQLIATGDGGAVDDWRANKSPPQFLVPAADMAGGTRQASDPYYAAFLPSASPPIVQGQPELPATPGTLGFRWVTFEFAVVNDIVDIVIEKPGGERLPIASLDADDASDGSSGFPRDGNISLVYADLFPSVTPRPDLTFGVIDNVEVFRIPEPSALVLSLFAAALAGLQPRRKRASMVHI
jgi:hypothetical protein